MGVTLPLTAEGQKRDKNKRRNKEIEKEEAIGGEKAKEAKGEREL